MIDLDTLAVDGWQVRAAPADRFTLEDNEFYGRAVPYNSPADLFPGLREQFAPGAFASQLRDPARVKVAFRHGDVIGHAIALEEHDDGLWIRGRVLVDDDLPEGRKALAQLRGKLVDELSVGFQQVPKGTTSELQPDGSELVTHKKVRLREVSLVPWGVYGRDARVTKVREAAAQVWRTEMLAKVAALGLQSG